MNNKEEKKEAKRKKKQEKKQKQREDFEASIQAELSNDAPRTRSLNLLKAFLENIRKIALLTRWVVPKGLAAKDIPFHQLNTEEKDSYDAFEKCKKNLKWLSDHYSAQYKGSFVLNYVLAVVAVFLAVISLGLLYYSGLTTDEHTEHKLHVAIVCLGISKFIILVLISINTSHANTVNFNERAITYRYLLEQFRHMMYLSLLGIYHTPAPSTDRSVSRALQNNYLEKYLQKKVLETCVGLRKRIIPDTDSYYKNRLLPVLEFLQNAWVKYQIAYQRDRQLKHEHIDEKLEVRVEWYNRIVIGAVVVDVILGIVLLYWHDDMAKFTVHRILTPFILAVAAIVPALVASFNALRFQTEVRGIAERSKAMAKTLEGIDKDYTNLINDVKNAKGNLANKRELTDRAKNLAKATGQTMVDEVAEWTFIYSNLVFDA